MKNYFVFLLTGVFLLVGCSSIQVASNRDQSVDFNRFKTYEYYGWSNDSGKSLTPFEQKLIEDEFGEEFRRRGLTYVKEGGDLVVALNIAAEDRTQTVIDTFDMGYGGFGYGPGWRWGSNVWGGDSMSTYHTYDYKVGTLVVDVYDAADKKLIWEGVGTKIVDDNPQTREKGIPEAVAAIMEQYPVAPLASGE